MENTLKNENQYNCIMDYLDYTKTILLSKPIMFVFSTFLSSIILSIANKTAVNASFVSVYIILSLSDWVSGIIASRVEQQEFKSKFFFNKPFLIMFSFATLYIVQQIIVSFSSYPHIANVAFDALVNATIFLLETMKLGLLIAFIIYELTSLRENFIRLKLIEFVRVVDVVLVPINKINSFVVKRFDTVVDSTEESINEPVKNDTNE